MKLILTGATGFTGSQVLKKALEDSAVSEVVVLSRRAIGVEHPKLKEIIVSDFTNYAKFKSELKANACIWALGVSQTEVSKQDYITITHDYAIAGLRVMLEQNPKVRFFFLSGNGADQDESKARAYFGKIKGRTEKALESLSPDVYIFRPGFIKPVPSHPTKKFIVKLAMPVMKILEIFSSLPVIEVDRLAAVMLNVAKSGSSRHLFENKDIVEAFDHLALTRTISRTS